MSVAMLNLEPYEANYATNYMYNLDYNLWLVRWHAEVIELLHSCLSALTFNKAIACLLYTSDAADE